MTLLAQSSVLVASFLLVYLWQQTQLASYTIQALGFLIFLYIITSLRTKGVMPADIAKSGYLQIFILNTVILLLIFSTGGLESALFFLLYFILFGIAFVFDPKTVFVFAAGVFLLFFQEASKGDYTKTFTLLGSILLISPLAFYFGKEFRFSSKLERKTQQSAQTIAKDIDVVLKKDGASMEEEDVEKLDEILEETEKLRKEPKD